MTDLTREALRLIGPILLGVAYAVFVLTFLEQRMRQSLHEAVRRSWRKPALFLAASNIVPIFTLCAWMAVSHLTLNYTLLVVVLMIASNAMTAGAVWSLAYVFATRNRHYNEWASLQLD
jgi:hypothetical protein